jgi:uncharacterized protein (DUF4415 family)
LFFELPLDNQDSRYDGTKAEGFKKPGFWIIAFPGKTIVSKKSIKSDLKRIDAMTDENIDYSDIPPLSDEFLTQETVSFSPSKQQLTIQLDQDILEWLKAQGKGYETQINYILREVMEQQQQKTTNLI